MRSIPGAIGGTIGPMREVVDGVFELAIGYVHAHLVVVDDGVVLVDTGLPGRSAEFGRALHEMRRTIGDVTTILLTHRHPDHTGGVAELKRRSGARVVAHERDAGAVEGREDPSLTFVQRLTEPLMSDVEPVTVDEKVAADGPISVPGFRAVHTPGHTAGHVSYLLDRAGGVLFAGDAATSLRGRVRRSPGVMTLDAAASANSLARLAGLDFDTVVFGHGKAVRGRAVESFRALAA
jgi:glyoxylase-like metal-dependent hydrolase (beta-lactamase superfamily II)